MIEVYKCLLIVASDLQIAISVSLVGDIQREDVVQRLYLLSATVFVKQAFDPKNPIKLCCIQNWGRVGDPEEVYA